jgi:hypothetical protein
MRIIRYLSSDGIRFACERHEGSCDIEGDIFQDFEVNDCKSTIVKILAPIEPRVILCIGLNYRKLAEATGIQVS